jgi:hypothetical protein
MTVLVLDHADRLPLIADACGGPMADYCARRAVVSRNNNQGAPALASAARSLPCPAVGGSPHRTSDLHAPGRDRLLTVVSDTAPAA